MTLSGWPSNCARAPKPTPTSMPSIPGYRSGGYGHKTSCHSQSEYACDEDGDGFHEAHINTTQSFWLLLRSWLRPHRGISQEKLPLYLGFFQFMHTVRQRGRGLLQPMHWALLTKPAWNTRRSTALAARKGKSFSILLQQLSDHPQHSKSHMM